MTRGARKEGNGNREAVEVGQAVKLGDGPQYFRSLLGRHALLIEIICIVLHHSVGNAISNLWEILESEKDISIALDKSSTPRHFTLQVEGQYDIELVSQRATTSCSSRIVASVHSQCMAHRQECPNQPSTYILWEYPLSPFVPWTEHISQVGARSSE